MIFAWFMLACMNPLILILGILLGGTWALTGARFFYQAVSRRRLRKEWRRDEPRHINPFLTPRWDEYDRDEPAVDSRCVCHNRKIPEGEMVLLWPETGSLGLLHVSVYCMAVKEPV